MSREEINKLTRKRGSIKAKLTIFSKFLTDIQDKYVIPDTTILDIDRIQLETRALQCEALINDFNDIQSEIEIIVPDDDLDEQYGERELFTSLFHEQMALAKKLVNKFSPPANIPSEGSSSTTRQDIRSDLVNVKLPPVEIPKFCGDYESWLEFRETFDSLIHTNDTLKNIQKFHYLKASLVGSAAQVIASLEFSAKNYDLAWDVLCERYNNVRLLVHNHVKALFNLEVIGKESSKRIRNIIDSVSKHLRSLKQLNQPTDTWDTLVIHIITSKLDAITSREWEEYKIDKDVPTMDHLKTFLKAKADLMETLEIKQNDTRHLKHKDNSKSNMKSFLSNNNTVNTNPSTSASYMLCVYCNKSDHFIRNCSEFLNNSIDDRIEHAKRLSLCFNCLRVGHRNTVCRLSNCRKCSGRHNTLLHRPKPEKCENQQVSESPNVSLTTYDSCSEHIVLATVLIQVIDENNKAHLVRAILDSASQSSFITAKLCRRLKLKSVEAAMAVVGLNNIPLRINSKCDVHIQAQHNAYRAHLTCYVIEEITGMLPNIRIDIKNLSIPKNIVLADPSFAEPGPIDMLIGANIFWELISIGQIRLGANKPILQKTTLGWILSGPIGVNNTNQVHCKCSKNSDIQTEIARFWELEEFSGPAPRSVEEKLCEQHFINNTKRDNSGRFIVSIPFRDSLDKLGDSKEQAKRRFYNLEKRLMRNVNLRTKYIEFMREYEQLGHMSKVSVSVDTEIAYYMPHHGVVKEDSSTTKLRVVFDASASTTSGLAINDLQMVGPRIQSDLLSILLRFRSHAYVIASDVSKMYRQVLVAPELHSLQRILWRYDPTKPLDIYELHTVTYGTSSAAFLAIRCLVQLAFDCKVSQPEISQVIEDDFYVDDLLTGADTIQEATRIGIGVAEVLRSGCFELRKWHSNEPEITKIITSQSSLYTERSDFIEIGVNENTKTLGLAWFCKNDTLQYNISCSAEGRVTKRIILSCIGQIFDPLGLLSPCVITAKIILQSLWQENLAWDESVPSHLHSSWIKFKKDLPLLNHLEIPRYALMVNSREVQLHGFSDASSRVYGACVYLRCVDDSGNIKVNLLCSKTKVAPIKIITIPKLELCGALLLARLLKKIQESLRLKLDGFTLWTDSTIVLGWIKISPNLLKTFIANRVSEIQDMTSHCQWRHISSKDNPADILSRGIHPSEMKSCYLWWNGPEWLGQCEYYWPSSNKDISSDNLPELKSPIRSLVVEITEPVIDINRFSSLTTLKRTTAFVLRFKNKLLSKDNCGTGILSVKELQSAFDFILKLSQQDSFPEELITLKMSKQIDYRSKIFNLNPFLDNNGIMRVGGRLQNSDFPYDKKHPIIVSSKHYLCKLIFRYEHLKLFHAGPQLLLGSIRDSLWPISGRNLAKATVRECLVCFRFNPKNVTPIMGNLPQTRFETGFPFKVTGVDYAGPFFVKDRKGRGCKITKSYIALFICFACRAIHLELVSDLSSDAFILALKRFMSRRGKPTRIYSDNATNFVGANSEMKEFKKFIRDQGNHIEQSCADQSIEWSFIPARSPHFGGLWEAGVKSCKYHLKRVMGNVILTFEEMCTVLAQIEAILNSRPLSPITIDPNDLNPLTPAHFLVGRPLTSNPEPDLTDISTGRLSRFQLIEQIRQNYWSRWGKEYISELQQRIKWKKSQGDLTLGKMVLIKEDQLPPMRWKLGRVVELHPGRDGVPRVASIKTSSGVVRRGFPKICPLPIYRDG